MTTKQAGLWRGAAENCGISQNIVALLVVWWCLFEKVRTHFAENPHE